MRISQVFRYGHLDTRISKSPKQNQSKWASPAHTVVKLSKVKDKKKSIRTVRVKYKFTYLEKQKQSDSRLPIRNLTGQKTVGWYIQDVKRKKKTLNQGYYIQQSSNLEVKEKSNIS